MSKRGPRELEAEASREEHALTQALLAIAGAEPAERDAELEALAERSPELAEQVRQRLALADSMPGFLTDLTRDQLLGEPEPAPPPERLGPYRVGPALGAGGMGEVFEGFDQRLGRKVALKRLNAHARSTPEVRSRFRREARVVAQLNHSGIVQVHDWLEEDDSDWIVMERVEGRSLKEILDDGPMPLDQALAAGAGIAKALAAAHEAGVVHRDLKSANVMVTHKGGVKILDFGISKRAMLQGPAVALQTSTTATSSLLTAESSLTAEGKIIGTVTAMSPEQAKGTTVDHRSDLFSFGVLLYQMLTGELPFQGPTPMDIMAKICLERHFPIRDLEPGLPEELSQLIDRLLEKEPADRPCSADEVAAALDHLARKPNEPTRPGIPLPSGLRLRQLAVVLPALLIAVWLIPRDAPDPVYVALTEPLLELDSGAVVSNERRAALQPAVDAVYGGLLRTLLSLEGISVREARSNALTASADGPEQLAARWAVDEIAQTRLRCSAKTCRVFVTRISAEDGRTLWGQSFSIHPDHPLRISVSIAEQTRAAFSKHKVRDGFPDLEVRPEDYALYLELLDRVRRRDGDLAEIASVLEPVQRSSPRFVEAFLLSADIARARFVESRKPELLESGFRALDRAIDLSPDTPWVLIELLGLQIDSGDLEKATETLRRLETLEPGDALVAARQAQLWARQGRNEEALALMREVADRRPSLLNLIRLADLEMKTGTLETARAVLERALVVDPGSAVVIARLAQLEMLSGSLQRAEQLYGRLVDHGNDETDLTNLGVVYLLLKDYDKATTAFGRVLANNPGSPFALLNAADAHWLSGNQTTAEQLYGQVLQYAREDSDPEWILTVEAQALAHLGHSQEALAKVQTALRLSPDNPQVLYESALVYTLTGDHSSAILNGRQALAKGVEPRWFDFAWFDPVRSELFPIDQ